MDTKKMVMVTSLLYSLTTQIFSLIIFLFHARVKNVLVKQSANVGKCKFHVANTAVAKQKGNAQTHMIKTIAILITANIWKNVMLFSSLAIYMSIIYWYTLASIPLWSGKWTQKTPVKRNPVLYNPSHFLQNPKANVKQNPVELSDIFFLNRTPQWKAT